MKHGPDHSYTKGRTLSGAAALTAPNLDCNDIVESGLYYFESATANRPSFFTNGTILHISRTATIHTQIAVSRASATLGRFAIRAIDGTSWSEWREGYQQGSILGPVSQSGGVPTGAVIERGSNANGEYTRFADGTQVCTHRLTSSAAGAQTWTYPASFAAPPRHSALPVSAAAHSVTIEPPGRTTTYIEFNCFDGAGARQAKSCDLTAIGRWL